MNRPYEGFMLPTQDNLSLARRMAVEGLLNSDPAERAARGGGQFEAGEGGKSRIGVRYLGREIWLSLPGGTMEIPDGGRLSLREEILILHYLERASGIPPTGKWISFAEIPGAAFYHPVFLQRSKAPLVKFFGEELQKLLVLAAGEMGGESLTLGDAGVRIPVFPRVPLGMVLWRGDEEFPPDGNLLFDSSITGYLPVEDIVILAETVVWKLIKMKNTYSPQRAQSAQS
jgi:hypothetical protein